MTVIHLKKKDIVKSSVKGVTVEFDHEKLASILGIPGNNGISEYVKDEISFMMLRIRNKVHQRFKKRFQQQLHKVQLNRRNKALQESTPRVLLDEFRVEPSKFQAEFERKRANRFHADLEKAKAENARLLALLHQAQSKPHP
ncbi:hypothetical protein Dimus_022781 [Dionaea muscipula]